MKPDDIALIRAALKYWNDEISPHGDDLAALYFDDITAKVPSGEETLLLRQRLCGCQLLYALCDSTTGSLIPNLYRSADEVVQACVDQQQIITVLVSQQIEPPASSNALH